MPAESLTAWQWFQLVDLGNIRPGPYVDFFLTPSVFDKARADLADLRLIDGKGQEVPYALRILRAENKQLSVPAEEFNHIRQDDRSDQLSLDLGMAPVLHNELILVTSGENFRRRVHLEGSDNLDKDWNVLEANARVLNLQDGPKVIDVRHVRYPTSRFRYLRVRVYPDPEIKDDSPKISGVSVVQRTLVPGEEAALPAALGFRESVRAPGGPGSAWTIDLGGDLVPCEKLTFEIDDADFVREYLLEAVSDPRDDARRMMDKTPRYEMGWPSELPGEVGARGFVTSGQWRRRAGVAPQPLEIRFPEVLARRFRLVVTDHRNPALTIHSVTATAAARQVVFTRPADFAGPLQLYFGNPRASAPNYDYARNLPATLNPVAVRLRLDPGVAANPDYVPIPKPWTDRWPWLIYVVLGAASLALLLVLGVLARAAIRRHDAVEVGHEANSTT